MWQLKYNSQKEKKLQHLCNMQEMHNFQKDLDYFNDGNIHEFFLSMYCEEETTLQGIKIHRCTFPDCGKTFRFKSEITRHCFSHSSTRPFHCKHKGCNKTFKRLDALENHARIHTKTKPFICSFPHCEQNFTTKAGLRYHLLKHKDERSYRCTLQGCEKSFLTASHLRQHQKTSVLHTKVYGDGSLGEEKSDQVFPDFGFTPLEDQRVEEDQRSQDSQTDSNSALEEDYQKFLNRILEQNKKLEKRLKLWQNRCCISTELKGVHTKKELESIFDQSEADSLNAEFSKWHDGF